MPFPISIPLEPSLSHRHTLQVVLYSVSCNALHWTDNDNWVLLQLRLPSFDTMLHNVRVSFFARLKNVSSGLLQRVLLTDFVIV